MNNIREKAKWPAIATLASLIFLLVFVATTNPLNNVSYIIIFFVGLLAFLLSFGSFVVSVQPGPAGRNRYKVMILSLFIIILLMFRSSQSLSLVDGLVLVLIIFGLWFYIDRRKT
jgi:uncharacterized membrane protein YbaN (DUF454 family)